MVTALELRPAPFPALCKACGKPIRRGERVILAPSRLREGSPRRAG